MTISLMPPKVLLGQSPVARFADQGIPVARKMRRLTGSGTALVKSSCVALFVIRGVQVWKSSEYSIE